MSKTLLAIDDSATMRKVFEITFGGEDFTVLTADNREGALARMKDDPRIVLIDTSLGGDDGYALCQEIRQKSAGAVILLLASKQTPYDAARGKAAGADDFLDKPFDTQAAIDKVRKAMLAKESGAVAAAAPVAAPSPMTSMTQTAPSMPSPVSKSAAAAPAAAPAPKPAAAAPAAAAPAPAAHKPAPAPAAAPAPTQMAKPATAVSTGNMAAELAKMGLSPQQADAVLSLTRDVVERAVWEVVPQMAEALIKEEIQRLMR